MDRTKASTCCLSALSVFISSFLDHKNQIRISFKFLSCEQPWLVYTGLVFNLTTSCFNCGAENKIRGAIFSGSFLSSHESAPGVGYVVSGCLFTKCKSILPRLSWSMRFIGIPADAAYNGEHLCRYFLDSALNMTSFFFPPLVSFYTSCVCLFQVFTRAGTRTHTCFSLW